MSGRREIAGNDEKYQQYPSIHGPESPNPAKNQTPAPELPTGKRFFSSLLMNPPFPHKQTDTPAEAFVDRALSGLPPKGRFAIILPTSLLVKRDKGEWRERILRSNQLVAVVQLPDELFQPFAAATTSIVILEKGSPHRPTRKSTFVRLNHDGLALKKTRAFRATPSKIKPLRPSMLLLTR